MSANPLKDYSADRFFWEMAFAVFLGIVFFAVCLLIMHALTQFDPTMFNRECFHHGGVQQVATHFPDQDVAVCRDGVAMGASH